MREIRGNCPHRIHDELHAGRCPETIAACSRMWSYPEIRFGSNACSEPFRVRRIPQRFDNNRRASTEEVGFLDRAPREIE